MNLSVLALTAVLGATALVATSCKREGCTDETALNFDDKAKKDDGSCVYDETAGVVNKTGALTANETWTANNIYVLNGKVYVPDGITLTIEPGTIIKGAEGQESLASALIVQRGGILMAEGTAANPIIFTKI